MIDMQISRTHKGVLLLVTGIILFLYSTGLITRGLNIIIIITSVLMIVYGFNLVDGQKAIRALIRRGKALKSKQVSQEKKDEPKE